jgi:hypothetical protein
MRFLKRSIPESELLGINCYIGCTEPVYLRPVSNNPIPKFIEEQRNFKKGFSHSFA